MAKKGFILLNNPSSVPSLLDHSPSVEKVFYDSLDLRSTDFVSLDTQIEGWGLPGQNKEASSDVCDTFFMKGCLNVMDHPEHKGVFYPTSQHCFSPLCPLCYLAWMYREAKRIDERFLVFERFFSDLLPNYKKRKPIHFALSVPQNLWYKSKNYLTSLCYKIAFKVGFLGGCLIWHPFRWNPDSGLWKFSPHFHCIGFGFIKNSKEVFVSTGWVTKNLGKRSFNEILGTAYYQLSHCGVYYGEGKKHSVTWFGVMSYNKLTRNASDVAENVKQFVKQLGSRCQVKCPYCGKRLKSLSWVGDGACPLPCSGIDGFYLANPEGWETNLNLFLSAREPEEWVSDREFRKSIDESEKPKNVLGDFLFC